MEGMLNRPETPSDAPGSHTKESILEGVNFFASLTLAYLGLTLAYYSVSDQVLPIYLMGGSAVSGLLLGVLRYNRRPSAYPSCVPLNSIADVPSGARTHEEKLAA